MDSRVSSSHYTKSELGDNYIIKNAGNFVPYPDDLTKIANTTSAAGALELTCIRNDIHHVLVTGHSDCKAMHLLYDFRNKMEPDANSPLELWIKKHGLRTVEKFNMLKKENNFTGPVPIRITEEKTFKVYIDQKNEYNMQDKLSQVNAVQQLENIAAYPFLHERLAKGALLLHALWYDVHSGKVFFLSRKQERFIEVNEDSYFALIEEVRERAANPELV